MIELSDETLMAYADGELDPARLAEVAAALAKDPEARARVRLFQDDQALLREAFAPVMEEPVPGRLLGAVTGTPGRGAREPRPRRWSFSNPWAFAMAASLLIGVGTGYLIARLWPGPPESPAWATRASDPLLHQALEHSPSGTAFARPGSPPDAGRTILPLLTFRDGRGRYCREFESSLETAEGPRVSHGVACREEGVWQPQALMARQLMTPTEGGDPPTEEGPYAPAMGEEVAGFDAILRQLMVEVPLEPQEEAALIDRGWR